MSVIRVSRCEVTRGTLSGSHVLTLICKIMTGGLLKIVLNWAVVTRSQLTMLLFFWITNNAAFEVHAQNEGLVVLPSVPSSTNMSRAQSGHNTYQRLCY